MRPPYKNIFEFWANIGPKQTIHPEDKEIFDRLKNESKDKTGHNFDLMNLLPECFMGPLRTAPVVLLYLSPGRGDEELAEPTDEHSEWYRKVREGESPLPAMKQDALSCKWWKARTKLFGLPTEKLVNQVAIQNIGAYHSKLFADHGLLAALPSSRVSIDWAQNELFPQAESGEKVVICLRAHKYWGLRPGNKYGKGLFTPESTRAGYICKGPMRDEIEAAVKSAVN